MKVAVLANVIFVGCAVIDRIDDRLARSERSSPDIVCRKTCIDAVGCVPILPMYELGSDGLCTCWRPAKPSDPLNHWEDFVRIPPKPSWIDNPSEKLDGHPVAE